MLIGVQMSTAVVRLAAHTLRKLCEKRELSKWSMRWAARLILTIPACAPYCARQWKCRRCARQKPLAAFGGITISARAVRYLRALSSHCKLHCRASAGGVASLVLMLAYLSAMKRASPLLLALGLPFDRALPWHKLLAASSFVNAGLHMAAFYAGGPADGGAAALRPHHLVKQLSRQYGMEVTGVTPGNGEMRLGLQDRSAVIRDQVIACHLHKTTSQALPQCMRCVLCDSLAQVLTRWRRSSLLC